MELNQNSLQKTKKKILEKNLETKEKAHKEIWDCSLLKLHLDITFWSISVDIDILGSRMQRFAIKLTKVF